MHRTGGVSDNADSRNPVPAANLSTSTLRLGTVKVCAVILSATLTSDHPDYLAPGHQVYCHLCFPALPDEDENIARAAELLNEAALRLHHIEQFSISERGNVLTGEPEIDGPMEDIHTRGRYLWVSKTPLKVFLAK